MLSPEIYKLVHVLGLLLVFLSLGGIAMHAINGGTRDTNRGRRLVVITYGTGLLLILFGGFGWLGASGIMKAGMPLWVWAKLLIWLAIGGLLALPGRKPELGRPVWYLAPLLGLLAGWLGGTKPF